MAILYKTKSPGLCLASFLSVSTLISCSFFSFPALLPAAAIAQQIDAQHSLTGTRWQLTKLDGKKIPENKYNIIPSILFDPVTHLVSGTGSCNRFVGKFLSNNNDLTLQGVVFTQKICMDETTNSTEQALKTAFMRTKGFQITSHGLFFLDEQGKKVAEFNQKKL